jgi:mono/diheme cytochrome c family protein
MLPVFNSRPFLNASFVTSCLAALAIVVISTGSSAAMDQVERGKYLVQLSGCNDCHTPGYFSGKLDMTRYLGGSDVGFEVPGMGTFVGRNLTPDKETGLGNWTKEQIVTAIQTGVRPDGRTLAPVMPWRAYKNLTKEDALAIVSYLKSIPAVHQVVPGPFGPGEKPTVPRLSLVMPDAASTR